MCSALSVRRRTFLRDFVPYRQTSRSASNIPFRIKPRSRQKRSSFSCLEKKKRLFRIRNSCQRTYNSSHQTSADSHPRLSTIESSPATALGLSCLIVSAAQGPFGLIPVCGALVPRGIDRVGYGPLVDCVVRLSCALL